MSLSLALLPARCAVFGAPHLLRSAHLASRSLASATASRCLSTSSRLHWPKEAKPPSEKAAQKDEAAFKKYESAASTEPDHFASTLSKKDPFGSKSEDKEQAAAHFKSKSLAAPDDDKTQDYLLAHPIWTQSEVDDVEITHREPKSMSDRMAYYSVQFLRKSFDLASGYTIGKAIGVLDERSVLIRCIFLETVAGVPGFAAAMIRHLHSLRRMQRDHGWIHTLLEEAENERMHLMTFLQLRNPGPVFRGVVIVAQWIFTAFFSTAYLVSPKYCHRFVGYLEEEAVITYTHILQELDSGGLPMWRKLPAPGIAKTYWQLGDDAMMRDVILAIRADEAHHRHVNHTLGSMDLRQKNPFKAGE